MNKQSREFSRNNQTTNSRNDSDSALASHRLNAEIVLFLFLPETRQNHSLLVWFYRIPNFKIPEFAAKIMLLEDHNSALRMDYIESIFTSFFSTSDRRCRLLRFPCCSLPSE